MPKAYSESERTYIKQRLMDEARLCLAQFGVRKTTVEELVKRVNIPKGTFYLFYDSKELLFFDVFCVFHDEIHAKLMSEITVIKENMTPVALTDLIFGLYKSVEESFLMKFLTDNEMEILIRKLPPETAKAHAEKDDLNMERLLSMIPGIKLANIQVFSAALRGIFLSMLHKKEIGEELFDDALKTMIHGIVLQLFEGDIL